MNLQLELTFDSPHFESLDEAPITYAIKVSTNRTERQGNCFY